MDPIRWNNIARADSQTSFGILMRYVADSAGAAHVDFSTIFPK